jgi:hypothetical protein
VPETTAAALARMRHGNIHWAAFEILGLAIPLFILFTGLGARLRRMCESISGRRWFWTITLFACAYFVLAALIAMPLEFYLDYVQPHAAGWSNQTLPNWLCSASRPIGRRGAANLAPLSIDRQEPTPLVALLRPRTHSVCVSRASRFARVGETLDDFFQASQRWPT